LGEALVRTDGATPEEEEIIQEALTAAGMIITNIPDFESRRKLSHDDNSGNYPTKPTVDPISGVPVTWPDTYTGCATFDGWGCVTVVPGSEAGSGGADYVYTPSPPPAPAPEGQYEYTQTLASWDYVNANVMTFVDTSPAGGDASAGLLTGRKLNKDNQNAYTMQGNTHTGSSYMMMCYEPDNSTGTDVYQPCTFMTMYDHHMRQLSIDEGLGLRRRRLEQIDLPETADSSNVHFDECLVFHCFAGDDHCEEPSPHEACLKIADDGSCADPLCKYTRGDDEQANKV